MNSIKRCICVLALAGLAAGANAQLKSEVYATGFTFPVAIIQDPTNPNVQFVVEQRGLIRTVINGVVQTTPFLDLSAVVNQAHSEGGLLGLAFDPDYANNLRFYVNFTTVATHTVIARFKRSAANPLVADATSRFDFLWGANRFIPQPFTNHNGGTIAFSPVDGYLYIGLGDGGSGNDPGNRAQDPNTWLGKFLRIDVNVADSHNVGFVVPPDNPFIDGQPINALHEIWAFGVRNPWKWSFDDTTMGGTGALVMGDVGQSAREEVNYEPAGAGARNYGWPLREGFVAGFNQNPPAYTPLTDPIWDYPRTEGRTVSGGYVYRGTQMGSYYFSRYFFGDYIDGKVWSIGLLIHPVTGEATAVDWEDHTVELGGAGTLGNVSSFGVNSNGEMFVIRYFGGVIRRIVADYTAVAPSSVNLFRGIHVSGNLLSLAAADNDRYVARPGLVLSSAEAPVQIIVEGTAPVSSTSDMRFVVKSHSSAANIQQRVELFDFVANAYVQVDVRALQSYDYTIQAKPTNPSRFIQSGTNLLRARISMRQTGPVLAFPWFGRIDQANWRFRN